MARRASSSINPYLLIGALVGVVVLVIAGRALLAKKATGFADARKLSVEELLADGNSLRGNEYVIEGQIDEKLQWTSGRGQLVSVKVAGGKTDDDFVAIEIPAQFSNLNIESKQRYAFKVKFRQGGVPVATAVNRL